MPMPMNSRPTAPTSSRPAGQSSTPAVVFLVCADELLSVPRSTLIASKQNARVGDALPAAPMRSSLLCSPYSGVCPTSACASRHSA